MPVFTSQTFRARVACAGAGLTLVVCAGLIGAAALAPAPPAVVPLLAVICVGLPVLAAFELAAWVPVLRGDRAVARLRRRLDALPETQHPLGL
jgi:hypothetical protein